MKHILDDSRGSHFWSTFWSPIDACYIPFQSSGSQQSNTSNGTQFGVETKKLQPLQVNHSEGSILQSVAKSPFCCEVISQPFYTIWWISSWSCPIYATRWKLRTSRWKPTSQPCENSLLLQSDFAALLCVCEISQTSFSLAKWSVVLPDVCYRHWEIFSIRFLLSKSQNTPCKPPITRFLSF